MITCRFMAVLTCFRKGAYVAFVVAVTNLTYFVIAFPSLFSFCLKAKCVIVRFGFVGTIANVQAVLVFLYFLTYAKMCYDLPEAF